MVVKMVAVRGSSLVEQTAVKTAASWGAMRAARKAALMDEMKAASWVTVKAA